MLRLKLRFSLVNKLVIVRLSLFNNIFLLLCNFRFCVLIRRKIWKKLHWKKLYNNSTVTLPMSWHKPYGRAEVILRDFSTAIGCLRVLINVVFDYIGVIKTWKILNKIRNFYILFLNLNVFFYVIWCFYEKIICTKYVSNFRIVLFFFLVCT